MKDLRNKIIFFILALSLTGCALLSPGKEEVLYVEFWMKNRNPLAQSLLDTIIHLNDIDGSDKIYQYVKKWKKENKVPSINEKKRRSLRVKDVKESFNLLPKVIYDVLEKKSERIILASDLGVPIIVLPVYYKNNDQSGRFIIFIDEKINFRGLNDWYNWREKTAFMNTKKKNDFKVDAYLSHSNSISDTTHYLMAQAIALMISWDKKFFPENLESNNFYHYPLIKLSWKNKKGVIHSNFDQITKKDFPFISFYGQSSRKYSFEKIFEFYQVLDRSNYVNLYSATGPLKDFVETLTIYIHTFYFNRPFHLDFYNKDNLLDSFTNCLKEARCLKKNYQSRILISEFFSQESKQ